MAERERVAARNNSERRRCTAGVGAACGGGASSRARSACRAQYADLDELRAAVATKRNGAPQDAARPPPGLLLTGHSLGGAAATVAAAYLGAALGLAPHRVTLVTFGEPRAGDATFAARVNAAAAGGDGGPWRVTHGRDLVPHVPACCAVGLVVGWCTAVDHCPHHHATQVMYPSGDMGGGAEYTVCDSSGEDYSCAGAYFSDSVEEHLNYFNLHVGTYCGWADESGSVVDAR